MEALTDTMLQVHQSSTDLGDALMTAEPRKLFWWKNLHLSIKERLKHFKNISELFKTPCISKPSQCLRA